MDWYSGGRYSFLSEKGGGTGEKANWFGDCFDFARRGNYSFNKSANSVGTTV